MLLRLKGRVYGIMEAKRIIDAFLSFRSRLWPKGNVLARQWCWKMIEAKKTSYSRIVARGLAYPWRVRLAWKARLKQRAVQRRFHSLDFFLMILDCAMCIFLTVLSTSPVDLIMAFLSSILPSYVPPCRTPGMAHSVISIGTQCQNNHLLAATQLYLFWDGTFELLPLQFFLSYSKSYICG